MLFFGHIRTTVLIIISITGLSLESQCVCSVKDSLPVYSRPHLPSTIIGTILTQECKPYLYPVDGTFTAILINKQLGFVPISVDQSNVIATCTENIWLSQTSPHPTSHLLATKVDTPSTTIKSTTRQTSKTTRQTLKTTLSRQISTRQASKTTMQTSQTTRPISQTTRQTSDTTRSTSQTTRPTSQTTTQISKTTVLKPQPSCPNGWIMHGYSCYLFHTNSRRRWIDANNDCVSKMSHLAILKTADEYLFLENQLGLRIDTYFHDDVDTSVWIAGTDSNHEGTWEWYDGLTNTYRRFTYTHWRHNEPDSGDGDHDEDCMAMVGNKGFTWIDYSCNANMFYVCEQSALRLTTVSTRPPQTQANNANCPPGWIMNHGSCYLFHTDSRYNWRNANAFCSSHHTHLAIIETAEEDNFIKHESSHRIHGYDDSDTGVWVAGSDFNHEGHWEWIDGFSHTSKPIHGYSNWYRGEPDSGDGDHDEDWMCLVGAKGFQWQDYHCSSHMLFICEQSITFSAPLVG